MTTEQAKKYLRSIPVTPPLLMHELLSNSNAAQRVARGWQNVISNLSETAELYKARQIYDALIALADVDGILIPEEIAEWELTETDVLPEWLLPEESAFESSQF